MDWKTSCFCCLSQNAMVCLAHCRQELQQKSWKTARLFLQDQDQDQMFKTKTKTFIFVLEAPRDQDPGLDSRGLHHWKLFHCCQSYSENKSGLLLRWHGVHLASMNLFINRNSHSVFGTLNVYSTALKVKQWKILIWSHKSTTRTLLIPIMWIRLL